MKRCTTQLTFGLDNLKEYSMQWRCSPLNLLRGFMILLIMIATNLQAVWCVPKRAELPVVLKYTTATEVISSRIHIAKKELGVKEETHAPRIKEYLSSVGTNVNAAWCNAYQYWIWQQVCNKFNIVNPMAKSGLANSTYDKALKEGTLTKYEAKVGDLIVWKNTGSYTGHIGMIIEINKTKFNSVTTIEGNTSSLSVRTGGAVEIKQRHLLHPIGKLKVRGLVGFRYENKKSN